MAGSRRRGLPDGIHYGGAIAFLVLVTFVSRVDVGLVDGLEMLLDGGSPDRHHRRRRVGGLLPCDEAGDPDRPGALPSFEAVRFMDGAQFEVFVADLFGVWHIERFCVGE